MTIMGDVIFIYDTIIYTANLTIETRGSTATATITLATCIYMTMTCYLHENSCIVPYSDTCNVI